MKIRNSNRFIICLWMSFIAAGAQGDEFPEIYNNERNAAAKPLAPHDAAATMQIPDDFKASVYAAEPDVQNPIAIAWDRRGRLWVAENYTYSDRQQRFDLNLRDRVTILEDTDQDGKADRRKVFTDQVQMLTSVELGHGGVWLMCPPRLLFIPDADEDDKPDGPAQTVLDGFTVAQSNYHNFANGLRWGPDGWLYGRCGHSCPGKIGLPGSPPEDRIPLDGGMWRYHPKRKTVEVLCHGTVNPWGHDWDKNGELFYINTVIGHVWHVIPGSHFHESFGESLNPNVYERLDTIADHYHFDTTGSWTESRGGAADAFGGGHAHVGMMIYQAGNWPAAYQDRLFTVNMHGMRVNVERLERFGGGYIARHEPDFIISKDPFFRAVEITPGPDGNAYLIDWSDAGECHEHTGVHRTSGRIFRITYNGSAAVSATKMEFAKPQCLAQNSELAKLWKAYQAGQTNPTMLRELLHHSDEHLRAWAIRLLTDFWPLDTVLGPRPNSTYPDDIETRRELVSLARRDKSGLVQIVLASTLQRLPLEDRAALATEILSHDQFANDRDLPNLLWYGVMPLADERPGDLLAISQTCRWPKVQKWIARSLAHRISEHPQGLDTLLQATTASSKGHQIQVIDGMLEAFDGLRQVKAPSAWRAFAAKAMRTETQTKLQELSVLFGDGRAIDQLIARVMNEAATMQTRQQALESLIEARPDQLKEICLGALSVRGLNLTAARGLALFDDAAIGDKLAKAYRRFHATDRNALLEILVSRSSFATALLAEVESGRIASKELSPFHARQILSLGNRDLSRQMAEVWGEVRDSPAERLEKIEKFKTQLTAEALAKAQLPRGRVLFDRQCAQCHKLYGKGQAIGPDLTGAQRASLEYLLENILDPSAVVGADHRMQIVETVDGRVLNGLIVSQNDQRIVLQMPTEQIAIPKSDVEHIETTGLSPMPDGLLDQLTPQDVIDLIGYLQHPNQVELPTATD